MWFCGFANRSPNAPPPFTLSELEPASVLPEQVYTKDELRAYLEYGRRKSRAAVAALTDRRANDRNRDN
jgi:hypothetical protein